MKKPVNVLAVDIGGNHVKILAMGQPKVRKLPSGPSRLPPKWSRASRSSPRIGGMKVWHSAIPDPFSKTGQLPIRTTWPPGGWVSISKRHLAAPSRC